MLIPPVARDLGGGYYQHETPQTYAIKWDAYQRYVKDDSRLIDELKAELASVIEPQKTYAIRSSANIEDSLDRSFAGQFKSVLHVQGVDNVLQAIVWSVWSSAQTAAVKTYLERHSSSTRELAMAVIVQEMVKPVLSAVALSRNPVTGGDYIVVEAVKGDGTQHVQSGATPLLWVNKKGYWVEMAKEDGAGVPLSLIE